MIEQYLNYDPTTGNVTDAGGVHVISYMGASPVQVGGSTGELVLQLVKQGVSADEIIKLKNSDLL